MESIVPRGRGLLSRPLYLARSRRGQVSLFSPSLQHRSFSHSCTSCLGEKTKPDSTQSTLPARHRLPDTPCRTRFAPSPTGYMHLGSLRTALFNYLLARATGGQFVLRIEDTDQTRLVPDAEERLLKDLRWAGLSWDEGPDKEGPYGPYRQSERLPLYKIHADKLVREGKAYRCFCSPEALEEQKRMSQETTGKTVYPGTCRSIPLEESDDRAHRGDPYAIRFKSSQTSLVIQDIVYNRFRNNTGEDEDFIIMKRDRFPTYHFANVVDDNHMKITHVIRGAEWLISTPKHVEMYNALGWEPPKFAHIGLLVDTDRKKLSKRDMSSTLEFYQRRHILPPALLNFLLFLGWRLPPGRDSVMTLQEMVDNFSLQFSKGDIVVALTKLRFLQNKHLERLINTEPKPPTEYRMLVRDFLNPLWAAIEKVQKSIDSDGEDPIRPANIRTTDLGERLREPRILTDPRFRADLFRLTSSNKLIVSRPGELVDDALHKMRHFVWRVPRSLLQHQLRQGQLDPVVPPARAAHLSEAITFLTDKIGAVDEAVWDFDTLKKVLDDVQADKTYWAFFETKNAQNNTFKPLRWALVASGQGLPVVNTMLVLGKEETLRRLGVAKEAAELTEVKP